MTFGFLNLNKLAGYTSHDCVARVRRLLRTKRVGHGGTLDPAAVGVLPIAVGKATRLLQFLPQDKAYQATIKFGLRTETDDLEGEEIESQPVPDLSLESIQLVLSEFQGKIEQIPPIYSAIQVGGKRLYKLARQGEVVQVPARTVEVYDLQILDWRPGDFPELDVEIACGPGTYIRAIARDLGNRVNAGATLAQLTRTQSSGFRLSQSLTLEELETQVEQQTFTPISGHVALSHLPECILSPSQVRSWFHGQQLSIRNKTLSGTVVRVSSQTGGFLGIGELEQTDLQWVLHPKVVFS
ncbi:tRNA pseudouridine(55) synthase TruB [Roseofilum reptotaenium CS-1145]|uniref:tRNA pseudouridine synthase B n=1 Tax=Roseofilum reptotaenium AO1-A TaxID=1925591 RepID=A0A1L9QJG6_9CYAN|nr:tRNA pseudouridine(55) synthase TruB [Roseofilum reptotaenium]MDB9520135.1 tRNA pseudouridine(55) synthase TruB [Roseofilum reptotaenium CS-1145]OJJ14098.1 tRNA pseudouridine(55) synthase TruB [Roseofilum reptotaenium AO1-A]